MKSFFDVWWTCMASCEEVWRILTDTTRWPEWGPSVRKVESSERFIAAGTKGRVHTPFGLRVPFEVTAYEHLRMWKWRVGGIAATGHRIEARGPRCRVVFEVPLAAFPYAAVCLVAARRIARISEEG